MNEPWLDEPDTFQAQAHGLAIYGRRNYSGAWCGYVGVPSTHPWFGKGYSDEVPGQMAEDVLIDEIGVINAFCLMLEGPKEGLTRIDCLLRCHGGITYAGGGAYPDPKVEDLWWFGFDCSHSGDMSPKRTAYMWEQGVYRDIGYVIDQCVKLAQQLAALF